MSVCPDCGLLYEEGGFCAQDGTRLEPTDADPLLGTTVGPYRLAGILGTGGMGRVYKGVNPTIRSRVAIKVLSHECAGKPDLVERFFAEARAVNLIRHESIVNVLDLARLPDGRPYIVMEFLDGAPLSRPIATAGRLPPGSLARFMAEVLDALGAAHAKGVVHRDIKPDNLYVTLHGRAKILDFGIAKLAAEHQPEMGPTRAGSLLGTPHYMSPEQAQARPADARADLYAVGVILYEATTGHKPFTGTSVYEVLRGHIERVPVPPRQLAPDLPAAYEQVILHALAKDPAHRFQSAPQLAAALGAAAAELAHVHAAWAPLDGRTRSDSVGPPTPSELSGRGGSRAGGPGAPARSTAGRRAALLAAAGLGLAVAVAAGIAIGGSGGEAGSSEPGGSSELAAAAPRDGGPAAADPASGDGTPGEPAPAAGHGATASGDGAGQLGAGDGSGERAAAAGAGGASQTGAGSAIAATARPGSTRGGSGRSATGRSGSTPITSLVPAGGADTPGPEAGAGGAPTADGAADGAVEPAAVEPAAKEPPAGAAGSRALGSRLNERNRTPAAWDVSGQLSRARSIAKSYFPDAVLVRIDADGVLPSGKANLALDGKFSVLYRFMSPSAAKRPADLPRGVEHKPTCIVYVSVEADEMTAYTLEGWSCDKMVQIRMPRCSAKQVWQRAVSRGASADNAVASLTYLVHRGRPAWWFKIDEKDDYEIDDDC